MCLYYVVVMFLDIVVVLLFIVLSFVVFDLIGGVGIQVDIMTLSVLGCYLLSVIIVIIVQDIVGVDGILLIDVDWIDDQVCILLEDVFVVVFKLGLFGSLENIVVIVSIVVDYFDILLILDLVLVLGCGD